LVDRREFQPFQPAAFEFEFDLLAYQCDFGLLGQDQPRGLAKIDGAFVQFHAFAHTRNVGAFGLESFLVKLKVIRRALP
jgi:hypothetical protein